MEFGEIKFREILKGLAECWPTLGGGDADAEQGTGGDGEGRFSLPLFHPGQTAHAFFDAFAGAVVVFATGLGVQGDTGGLEPIFDRAPCGFSAPISLARTASRYIPGCPCFSPSPRRCARCNRNR